MPNPQETPFPVFHPDNELLLALGTEKDDDFLAPPASSAYSGAGALAYGLGGNDTIRESMLDDRIYGGEGNDTILSSGGNDVFYGEAGDDTLGAVLHAVKWYYFTSTYLDGGSGIDTAVVDMSGYSADDLPLYSQPISTSFILAAEGDSQFGTATLRNIERVIVKGTVDDDTFRGGQYDDVFYGNQGDDTLYDGAGADTLNGGEGDDRLHASSGNDSLNGGEGNDTLYLDQPSFVGNEYLETGTFNGGDGLDTAVIDLRSGVYNNPLVLQDAVMGPISTIPPTASHCSRSSGSSSTAAARPLP